MKLLIKTGFLLFIIFCCIGFAVFFIINKPTGNVPITGVEFEIKKGDSTHSISKKLYLNGYIKNETLFVIINRALGYDKLMRPGYIMIKNDSSTFDIIKTIASHNYITITFTIPEGSTIKQIREILVTNKIVKENDIDIFLNNRNYPEIIGLSDVKTAEGFLFPDTYKVFKGVEIADVFSEMVDLFYKKLSVIYPDYKNLSQKELYNKIIMASIIEREVKNTEEAPVVAGVFYNRIKINMRLQSCATVQYILDKPKEHLLESDLFVDSPFNTYINTGLPPAPISSPGINSLKASFYPEKNNYLFFVVNDPVLGTHYFSSDYNEHLIAQKKYKAIKGFF